MSLKTGRLLALCYAAALALWLLVVGAGAVQTAYYRHTGLGATESLGLEDFTLTSIKDYENEDDPEGAWFVSTDSDPQIIWEGKAYLNRVVLKIRHEKPGNGVELYYRLGGQEQFSEKQVVYAKQTPEGWYSFDLRGKKVSGLRLDPDSLGGVPTRFEGVELNAPWPWWKRLIPTGAEALLLVGLPLGVAALLRQIAQWQGKEL